MVGSAPLEQVDEGDSRRVSSLARSFEPRSPRQDRGSRDDSACCPSSPEEEVAWKWPASHRRPPPRRRRRLTRPKHTIILYTQASALRLQSDRAPHDARRRVIYVFFFVDSSSSSRRRRAFHRARRGFHPIGTRSAESHRPTNRVSLSRAFSLEPHRVSLSSVNCDVRARVLSNAAMHA